MTSRGNAPEPWAVLPLNGMDETAWGRLITQLKNGDCTPFIGAGANGSSLPNGGELSNEMAGKWGYPFEDRKNLTRVAQYGAIKLSDPVFIKQEICEHLNKGPSATSSPEPHAFLAKLPISVYLTTNYDDLICRSLRENKKEPNQITCPWNPDITYESRLFERRGGFNPGPDKPLVYHLHGTLREPSSILVTEDDYVDFMVNLMEERINSITRMLPPVVQFALTRRSLLFIGYSMQDWNFRFFYSALSRAIPMINRRRHISVQLAPKVADTDTDVNEVKNGLKMYYERQNITIFWGTAEEFFTELGVRMGVAS
ncbi:SIR2 family NAD-dependent protein deacylase [Herbidospora mongoliensis]|uniref:SIR2 family NAD-dependent protein deacylase n=1 Tax=Herbidospora mongoliensis TaxID=688067 RepID=UPI000AAB8F81|nr:SIR2 family protein [Herbidospora mongoliensis]